MKVKIKKLTPDATVPFKTYKKDFCYDCVAVLMRAAVQESGLGTLPDLPCHTDAELKRKRPECGIRFFKLFSPFACRLFLRKGQILLFKP